MSKLRRIIGGMLALTVAVSACALPVPTITAADTAAADTVSFTEDSRNINEDIIKQFSGVKSIIRIYSTDLIKFALYDKINDIIDTNNLLAEYLIVDYSQKPTEYYTISKNGELTKIDSIDSLIANKAMQRFNDTGFVKNYISPDAETLNIYYLSGEADMSGSAVYYATTAGDFVYYNGYKNGELLFPAADFCEYQKAIMDESEKYPMSGGRLSDLDWDLSEYKLKKISSITDTPQPEDTTAPEESTQPIETAPTEEATEAAEQNGVKTEKGFEYIIVGEGDEAYAEITGYTGEGGYISLRPAIGGYPVRSIGAGAFKGQEKITSIHSLSRNLESIGEGAFEGCTALEDVTVPISVKSVGADAFKGCTSLVALDFRCKDCTIDPTALEGCTGLTVYVVPASEVEKTFRTDFPDISIDYTNTNDPVVIEADGIEYRIKPVVADGGDPTRINYKPAAYVSGAAEGITEITIPDKISGEFGDYEVVGIYEKAFAGQDKLASVTLPDSLVTIEAQAFYGTTALKTIDLPDSLFLIMDGAFACSGLTEITLPENCYVGSEYDPAFPPETSSGPPVKDNFYGAFEDCKELTSFTGSKVMTLMMSRMFKGCEKLTEVRGIEGITRTGYKAFYGCSSLEEIEFSEAITDISKDTFDLCPSLRKIVIPADNCGLNVHFLTHDVEIWCYEDSELANIIRQTAYRDNLRYLDPAQRPTGTPTEPTEAVTAVPTDYAAEPGSNPGDANCDGKVNVSDVVAILQYICSHEKYPLTPEGQLNAEVDGYAGITGGDAILVQKMDAGIYTPGKK